VIASSDRIATDCFHDLENNRLPFVEIAKQQVCDQVSADYEENEYAKPAVHISLINEMLMKADARVVEQVPRMTMIIEMARNPSRLDIRFNSISLG
jgi:hypothetical protein